MAIRLRSGRGNLVATNHVVGRDVGGATSASAFAAQVDALLTTAGAGRLEVTAVAVDRVSTDNTVLDSGTDEQVALDRDANAFRAAPDVGWP